MSEVPYSETRDPMAVHASRAIYFEHLKNDPYGFNNDVYYWKGEDKFVFWMLGLCLVGLAGIFTAQAVGYAQPLSLYTYALFAIWIGIELVGKAICSYIVQEKKVKINYVRKLGLRPWRKLKTYVIPFLLVSLFGLEKGATSTVTAVAVLFFLDILKTIGTEWHVIRRQVPLFRYAFVSWDRLEDRPYTLRYDILEDLMRFLVYLPFIALFGKASFLILIPNLINEFGDGLAEPVGLRFGKHKYRARSLWYDGKFWNGNFVRSIEGSFMVLLVSAIILCVYSSYFTGTEFWILMAVLPILMTLAEAVSPHTNDGPMLALVGCSTIWGVTHFF